MVSHNFFTPVLGTWGNKENTIPTKKSFTKYSFAHLPLLWKDHLPTTDHKRIWFSFLWRLVFTILVLVGFTFVLIIGILEVHFPLENSFHLSVPAIESKCQYFIVFAKMHLMQNAFDAPLFYQRDSNEKEASAYKCLACNVFPFKDSAAVLPYRWKKHKMSIFSMLGLFCFLHLLPSPPHHWYLAVVAILSDHWS